MTKDVKPTSVEMDVERGYMRIGRLFNKIEIHVPEGHTCKASGFVVRKGKVTRKGRISISKRPNEDRKTRISVTNFTIEG